MLKTVKDANPLGVLVAILQRDDAVLDIFWGGACCKKIRKLQRDYAVFSYFYGCPLFLP